MNKKEKALEEKLRRISTGLDAELGPVDPWRLICESKDPGNEFTFWM